MPLLQPHVFYYCGACISNQYKTLQILVKESCAEKIVFLVPIYSDFRRKLQNILLEFAETIVKIRILIK